MSYGCHPPLAGGERRICLFEFQGLANLVDHEVRCQRQATVVEQRDELVARRARLELQQRPELRVAVLLDDEALFVAVEKLLHGLAEWEGANSHVVERDALRGQA